MPSQAVRSPPPHRPSPLRTARPRKRPWLSSAERGEGHNRQLITEDEVQEIKEAVAVLKSQPVVPTAPDKTRAAGSTLKKIKERLGRYLDAFMLEASKSAGKELIKQLGKFSRWWLLLDALTKLAQSVFNWLH
jgi:hypothetical protein